MHKLRLLKMLVRDGDMKVTLLNYTLNPKEVNCGNKNSPYGNAWNR